MKPHELANHCRFASKKDGSGLSYKVAQPVNLLGAKNAAAHGVAHTLSGTDVRVKIDMYPGVDGKNWESNATNLYDSGSGSGIAGGAFSGSATDVTKWALGLVEITIAGTSGEDLKQIEMSSWIVTKPF